MNYSKAMPFFWSNGLELLYCVNTDVIFPMIDWYVAPDHHRPSSTIPNHPWQSPTAHRKWPEMVVSASTNQVWTKITIRSYAWSFGHSDLDPSRVALVCFGLILSSGVCGGLRGSLGVQFVFPDPPRLFPGSPKIRWHTLGNARVCWGLICIIWPSPVFPWGANGGQCQVQCYHVVVSISP